MKDKLRNRCKACRKIDTQKYYTENRERILKERDRITINSRQRERRKSPIIKNKDRLQMAKWLSIPQNKIASNMRRRIRQVIKGAIKSHKTEELLGCSYEYFKSYIESK